MRDDKRPVAVFDSGLGGISVLRELLRVLPNENYIYFGDTKNAPYGMKTKEEVRKLCFANVRYLLKRDAKAIVIACNTATSAAANALRERYREIPIIGIEPAIKPAVLHGKDSDILVMATPMTLKEEKFHNLMDRYEERANIIPLPCPGLMEYVEKGILEGEALEQYFEKLFEKAGIERKKIDAIVLGCTHYPFVKKAIRPFFRSDVYIIDGGFGTAKEAKRRIIEAGIENASRERGKIEFISSLNQERFTALAKQLLFADFISE